MLASSMASDAVALRSCALALHAERNALEGRLLALLDALGPLASGPLVDAEGFPVSGVDLYAVAAQRQEVARLRTDVAKKSQELEAALLSVHAAAAPRGGGGGGTAGSAAAVGSGATGGTAGAVATGGTAGAVAIGADGGGGAASAPASCLAVLGEVTAGGPAAEGGLQPGDYVVAWDGLAAGGCGGVPAGLHDLALSARACALQGRPLRIKVLRAGVERVLEVRPGAWAGEGVLGCRLLEVKGKA